MVKVFNSYKIVCGNFDWKKHQRTKAPLINLRNKKCPPELVKKFLKKNHPRDLNKIGLSVLALDPGSRNFGWCWIKSATVKRGGILPKTIYEIKGGSIDKVYAEFIEGMIKLLDETKPDIIVAERFVVRGFGANLAELVSYMLAFFCYEAYKRSITFELLTAAQWKTALTKITDLPKFYDMGKAKYKLPPHPIDAMCMGRFIMNNKSFEKLDVSWIKKNMGGIK